MFTQDRPHLVSLEAGTHYLCTCGKTGNIPYCDGSHKGSESRPHKLELTETKPVAVCGCGRSANLPFCDGAHSQPKS